MAVSTRWSADVRVQLRSGIADPEGQTIGSALRSLGYGVKDVRHGTLLHITFSAGDREDAERQLDEMCRRLLANPVMEVASWELATEPVADVGVVPR
jgi:phosphoribosylformylglycinamidine synthase